MCKYLYHYTTLDVIPKIFNDSEGKTIELKLKNYHFLNDEYEGKWLAHFMRTCKKEIVSKFEENEGFACEKAIEDFVDYGCYRMLLKEQNDKHYSFSMSELRDSMLFWRQDYAKNNGIALCAEKTEFENKCKRPVEQVRYLSADTINDLLPDFVHAIKRDAQYIKCRSDLKKYISDNGNLDILAGELSLEKSDFLRMKNFTWEAEKEWRIIVSHKYNGKKNLLKRNDVEIDEHFVPRYRMIIENPFNEIVLGPSFSDYYVESVGEWFDRKKYKIKVSKSVG